jgi:hypothetical protein
MSRDGGWIFVDVLVALGVLAVALGFLAPAVGSLGRLELAQESRVFSSMAAALGDPWASFR